MTINLDDLRKTAEAATPGPWDLYSTQDYEVFCAANFTDSNYDPPAVTYGSDRSEDAEFIATFDPPTVLALLSRLEQAEQAVDDLRGRYDEAETARIDGDAQLDRVRELHSYGKLIYPNGDEEHYCTYDENAWPCETIRALDGEQA